MFAIIIMTLFHILMLYHQIFSCFLTRPPLHHSYGLSCTEPKFFGCDPKHVVHHWIPTSDQPVWNHQQHLDPSKLHAVKLEFESEVGIGIIHPLSSQWALPLHMLPKPNEKTEA